MVGCTKWGSGSFRVAAENTKWGTEPSADRSRSTPDAQTLNLEIRPRQAGRGREKAGREEKTTKDKAEDKQMYDGASQDSRKARAQEEVNMQTYSAQADRQEYKQTDIRINTETN